MVKKYTLFNNIRVGEIIADSFNLEKQITDIKASGDITDVFTGGEFEQASGAVAGRNAAAGGNDNKFFLDNAAKKLYLSDGAAWSDVSGDKYKSATHYFYFNGGADLDELWKVVFDANGDISANTLANIKETGALVNNTGGHANNSVTDIITDGATNGLGTLANSDKIYNENGTLIGTLTGAGINVNNKLTIAANNAVALADDEKIYQGIVIAGVLLNIITGHAIELKNTADAAKDFDAVTVHSTTALTNGQHFGIRKDVSTLNDLHIYKFNKDDAKYEATKLEAGTLVQIKKQDNSQSEQISIIIDTETTTLKFNDVAIGTAPNNVDNLFNKTTAYTA